MVVGITSSLHPESSGAEQPLDAVRSARSPQSSVDATTLKEAGQEQQPLLRTAGAVARLPPRCLRRHHLSLS